MEATIRTNDKNLFDALLNFLKTLNITVETKDNKKKTHHVSANKVNALDEEENSKKDLDWNKVSKRNLSRAYSNDEPDYTVSMVKEPNPDYGRR